MTPASADWIWARNVLSVAEARDSLEAWRAEPEKVVVLLRDVESLQDLARGGLLAGTEVNLGGLHSAPGRKRVLPYLFLSPEERNSLEAVARTGAHVAARDLPASRAVELQELLDGG